MINRVTETVVEFQQHVVVDQKNINSFNHLLL